MVGDGVEFVGLIGCLVSFVGLVAFSGIVRLSRSIDLVGRCFSSSSSSISSMSTSLAFLLFGSDRFALRKKKKKKRKNENFSRQLSSYAMASTRL